MNNPLTPDVMVMRGLTCRPVVLSVCMSGLYLAAFSPCAVFENLLWQQVNSMNCMVFDGVGIRGGGGCLWERLVRIVYVV